MNSFLKDLCSPLVRKLNTQRLLFSVYITLLSSSQPKPLTGVTPQVCFAYYSSKVPMRGSAKSARRVSKGLLALLAPRWLAYLEEHTFFQRVGQPLARHQVSAISLSPFRKTMAPERSKLHLTFLISRVDVVSHDTKRVGSLQMT